jgi:hypothetical protein
MTRGHRGSLLLRCGELSSPAPCRFAPAHPTFTIRRLARVGAQLYPGSIAARYRNPARGLARPSEYRTGETALTENEDRASRQPIAASFGAGDEYRGFNHWYRFPAPFCLASGPGPLAADRSYIVEGRLPPDAAPPASVLPSSFSRPLRRPGARPHPHPDIRRLMPQTWSRREPALSTCTPARRPFRSPDAQRARRSHPGERSSAVPRCRLRTRRRGGRAPSTPTSPSTRACGRRVRPL